MINQASLDLPAAEASPDARRRAQSSQGAIPHLWHRKQAGSNRSNPDQGGVTRSQSKRERKDPRREQVKSEGEAVSMGGIETMHVGTLRDVRAQCAPK